MTRTVTLHLGRLLAVILCSIAVVFCGCRSSIQKRVQLTPELVVSAAAVFPFAFRWDEPAYRSFEFSQRLITVALKKTEDRVLFFGPSEFKILQPQLDYGWATTDALAMFTRAGVQPERAVMIRPWAEKRVLSAQRQLLDAKGRNMGWGNVEETTFIGHVDVVHPSSHDVIIELSSSVTVDPFAERDEDDFDPTPELTALMDKLFVETGRTLARCAQPVGPLTDLQLNVVFNPKIALTYSELGRPSAETKIASLDPLEAELFGTARIRFANPTLAPAETAKLSRLPGGLYVLEAPPSAKFQAGDLITMIDGQPALPQTLHRMKFANQSIPVKARRSNGEFFEILLP